MHVKRTRSWFFALGLLFAGGMWSPLAGAGDKPEKTDKVDKKECAQTHAEAQKSIRATTLRRAKDQLKICSRDECPAFIRKDCVGWLDEVNASMPSIVVAAKGPDGKETFDAKLSINNEAVAAKLDVKAIELDPGTVTLKLEREGSAPIEKEVVLRQGEKNKLVEMSFAPTPPPGGEAKKAMPRDAADKSDGGPRQKTVLPYVLGGLGVALIGGGAFFWVKSSSDHSELEKTCAPRCTPDQGDKIETQRLLGDVLATAGIFAVGAAIVWIVTGSSSANGPKGSGVQWTRTGPPSFSF